MFHFWDAIVVFRYQLFAQIQRDILHARLVCPQSDAAALGGYILQGKKALVAFSIELLYEDIIV